MSNWTDVNSEQCTSVSASTPVGSMTTAVPHHQSHWCILVLSVPWRWVLIPGVLCLVLGDKASPVLQSIVVTFLCCSSASEVLHLSICTAPCAAGARVLWCSVMWFVFSNTFYWNYLRSSAVAKLMPWAELKSCVICSSCLGQKSRNASPKGEGQQWHAAAAGLCGRGAGGWGWWEPERCRGWHSPQEPRAPHSSCPPAAAVPTHRRRATLHIRHQAVPREVPICLPLPLNPCRLNGCGLVLTYFCPWF